MEKKTLLYKLTGTETPKFITERENQIIDKCLAIINDLENMPAAVVSGLPVWKQIDTLFEDENLIHVDAYVSEDGDESGVVIAKINKETKEVLYFDERARTDKYAQEKINEVLTELEHSIR